MDPYSLLIIYVGVAEMLTSGSKDTPQGENETSITDATLALQGVKRTHDDAFAEKQREIHGDDARPSSDTGESEDEDGDVSSHTSITNSVSFKDAVFRNPILFELLTSQEIMRAKCVVRGWRQMLSDNISISAVRRQDESRDWFFPLFSTVDRRIQSQSSEASRMLHGMWHESGEFSSTSKLCKLPPVGYLPPPTSLNPLECNCKAYHKESMYIVKASSGGLLLLQEVTALRRLEGSRNISNKHNIVCEHSAAWPDLTVINPLMQQSQVLPNYERPQLERWMYCKPQLLMMVDEIANSYKVLFYRCLKTDRSPMQQLIVYDSKSMKWENVDLIHPPILPAFGCWTDRGNYTVYTSLCARGQLYLADIRKPTAIDSVNGHVTSGVVRLFQVDMETGQQILHSEFPICKLHKQAVKVLEPNYCPFVSSHMLRNLELVECMEHLYAVIPARLDEFLYQPNRFRENMWENEDTMGSTFMPLQFYIFQLEGDVGVEGHGVVRIQLLTTRKNCQHLLRRRALLSNMWITHHERPSPDRNWFACTSRGSVIWVTVADYLLQYNILSGESKTEMLPTNIQPELPGQIQMEEKVGVAYRASFHMKP